ncbi:MAG: hypothetical protein ACT6QU_10940 [Aliihoeflea sp.]|uniref:hypothetical protein n=1 Tax=Aliihoeflea sp. TaxID=2608088 RepID=UPI004033F642
MPVEQLPSARLRDARQNLEAFIERARSSTMLRGNRDFDAHDWNVSHCREGRASAHNKVVLYFTTHENGSAKGMSGRRPMLRPFGDFIKALVCLRYEANPKHPAGLQVMIRASRYLHDAIIERSGDPCSIMTADFDAASNACRAREAESSRYRIGQFLQEIARWLNRYAISKGRIDFTNPFPRVAHDHTRIGKEHEERRKKKLPTPTAFEALGAISNLVEQPWEVVLMRAVEILVATGMRLNEALTLPEDCEVEEEVVENGKPVFDQQGRRKSRYGLRYWPEKSGGQPEVKWIQTVMVDVVKRAIRDIRTHTAPGRKVARWLADHPGRAFLEPTNDHGPEQLFSGHDLSPLFGLSGGNGGNQWARGRSLKPSLIGRTCWYRRADIERALLAEQWFPGRSSQLSLSQYLFLVPLNFCHDKKGSNPSVVCVLADQQIRDFLCGRGSKRGATQSIFARYGFTEADGSPIKLTSHMFRHWLNTLAQQGGMGEHEIARWFGRKDIGHNAEYDHVTGMQKAEEVRRLMENGSMRGTMAELHDSLPPVMRPAFRESVVATAHTTDIGLCVTDWSLAPCPDHGSCGRCGEHLVIKGDLEQKRAAEELLTEHEWFLADAVAEADQETYGASNYVAHHQSMVDGLRSILAVHNDPAIPDGSVVHVNRAMPSRLGNRPLQMANDA